MGEIKGENETLRDIFKRFAYLVIEEQNSHEISGN